MKNKLSILLILVFCVSFSISIKAAEQTNAANSKVVESEITEVTPDNATGEEILEETQSKVVVHSYEVSEGEMAAGEKFKLKIYVENTNRYNDAYNLMVTLTSETDNVRIQDYAPNQQYIEYLPAGEIGSVEFDLEVAEVYQSDTMILDIYLDLVDGHGIGYSITSIITPQIVKQCEMQINALSVANSAVVGSKSLVNVRYSNTGVVKIDKVTMHIEGDIMDSPKEVELEALDIGEQKYLDYYVNFLNEGNQNISISFTYEDSDGEVHEIDPQSFVVSVTPFSPIITSVTSDGNESILTKLKSVDTQNLLLYGILICAVVLFILMGVSMLVSARKNGKRGH